MSYEKDKLDSFLTSASASAAIATALAPYVTSNSLSAALAALDLSPYVTSNSLSAAIATDVLTVRGGASVSATMSAAAVTVAGRPVGPVLLGYSPPAAGNGFTFSGSWSDYGLMTVEIFAVGGSGTTRSALGIDASDILISGPGGSAGSGAIRATVNIAGHDGAATKLLSTYLVSNATGTFSFNTTATANSGFVNHFKFSITGTASIIIGSMYGWRKA